MYFSTLKSVADPGFSIGRGTDLVRGCQLPRQLRFKKIGMSKRKNLDPGAPAAPPGSANAKCSFHCVFSGFL